MKRCAHAVSMIVAGGAIASPSYASTNWDLLKGIQVEEIVTEDSYEARKTFPSEIKDGVEQFDITGYVVLLWQDKNVSEFILISDMGFCPFCGDPEHGASLQVMLSSPEEVMEDGQRVTLRGALETVLDPETTQATRLTGAQILR